MAELRLKGSEEDATQITGAVQSFEEAVRLAVRAGRGPASDGVRRIFYRRASTVTGYRAALTQWLEEADRWLCGQPKDPSRDERWVVMLRCYERTIDALERGQAAL